MKMSMAFAFLCLWNAAAMAHHGNSEFDLSSEVRYEGTVVENLWKNPHVVVKVATQTAEGEQITLEVEGASPSILRVGGFNAQSLVPGDRVSVVVSPSRRYPKENAYGYEIVKSDGLVVPLVSSRLRRTQSDESASSIFGTWVSTSDSFTRFTRSLNTWSLTEKASEIRSKYTPVDSGQARCVPVAAPMLMTYPVVTAIEEMTDHIAIRTEWLGAQRTIYTDGRAHPGLDQRFQQGHSIGKWEDKGLVVDTTNFSDQETGGIPSGGGRHLIERFSLNADGKSLVYEYTLEDPEFLAAEVTGNAEWSFSPNMQLTGVECDTELAQRFFREFK